MNQQLCYLDNAAAEPLRPEVMARIQATWQDLGGLGANPSSSHAAGRRAAAILETARAQIARLLGADPAEVLFTGGGSESVALAVRGIATARHLAQHHAQRHAQDLTRHQSGPDQSEVWYSAIEHDSVRQAAHSLAPLGITSRELAVDAHGVLCLPLALSPEPARPDLLDVPAAEPLPGADTPAPKTAPSPSGKSPTAQEKRTLPPPARPTSPDRPGGPVADTPAVPDRPQLPDQHQIPALVSVMSVCNENGVIQPLAKLRAYLDKEFPQHVPLHTDAIQAAGRLPLNFHHLGVDAMSIAAHKFGGPTNAGLLVVKRDTPLVSDRKGGGQERQIRGGTQDVLAAAGLAAALELAETEREKQVKTQTELRKQLLTGIAQLEETQHLSGIKPSTQAPAVPGIVQLVLERCQAEALLLGMDQAGVCVSAGSACHTGVARPSNVLLAQGYDAQSALGTLRISFGWQTTAADVDRFLAALPQAVALARRLNDRKE